LTVLVTGASGFIGAHVVMELLERGFTVKAMLRDEKLATIFPKSEKLEIVVADLFDVDSLRAAVSGCDDIIHCAAALYVGAKDVQKEVVDPSVIGVDNLCSVMEGVKRIIHTSSVAAIRTTTYENGQVFSVDDWCNDATIETNPYGLAKVEAERKIRRWAEERDVRLVTIHPSVVFGPILHKRHSEGSMSYLKHFTGKLPFVLDIQVNFVDVRDVAKAHVNALDLGENGGRFLIHNKSLWFNEIGCVLNRNWPTLPRFLAFIISLLHPKLSWKDLKSNLGSVVEYDVGNSFEVLCIEKTNDEKTLKDGFSSLKA
jgi:nucleoside-diphosphate-sugar epimerase